MEEDKKTKVESDTEEQTAAESSIEDAEVIEETAPLSDEESVEAEEELEKVIEAGVEDDAPEFDDEEVTDAPDTEQEITPEPEPSATPDQPVRRVGLVGTVIGGLIAGGIGFGAAYYTLPKVDPDILNQQQSRISDLQGQVEDLSSIVSGFDPEALVDTAVAARVDALDREISGKLDGAAQDIAALGDRIAEIEVLPLGEGETVSSVIEATHAQTDALRSELEAQQARIQEIADAAAAQLQTARDAAAQDEAAAQAAQEAARNRVALSRVQTALEVGTPFADALGDLQAAVGQVPAAISSVANDGVSPLAELQESFPAVARNALDVARREGIAGDNGGAVGGFFSNLLNIRSVEPREGDDVDAVLSRAEAAVREGRLSDALAEVETLPELARAELSDWISAAQTRADAVSAANDLSVLLNQ